MTAQSTTASRYNEGKSIRLSRIQTKISHSTVFISYERKDKGFVKNVYDSLSLDREEEQIWVDWDDIPPTENWMNDEVYKHIEAMDTFVLVLSPGSCGDAVVKMEINWALKHGKRIVPIACKPIHQCDEWKDIGEEIKCLPQIEFLREDDFNSSMKILKKTLEKDIKHVKTHTTLLADAIEWERRDFAKSLLLGRKELKYAQRWLSASALGKEPRPTMLHLAYLNASHNNDLHRQINLTIAVFMIFFIGLGTVWPSWGTFILSLTVAHVFAYVASINWG